MLNWPCMINMRFPWGARWGVVLALSKLSSRESRLNEKIRTLQICHGNQSYELGHGLY